MRNVCHSVAVKEHRCGRGRADGVEKKVREGKGIGNGLEGGSRERGPLGKRGSEGGKVVASKWRCLVCRAAPSER